MFCQKYFSRCQRTFHNSPAIVSGVVENAINTVNPNKVFQAAILGLPGKYKKRLAENVANTFHLSHLPIPQVLSGHLKQGSELGRILKFTARTGIVLPDAYVIKFVKQSIASLENKSFVITGFPSTFNQAWLFWKEIKLDLVVYPLYPEDVLTNFLFEDSEPPETDAEKHKRFIEARKIITRYEKKVQPVLKFYENEHVLVRCYSNTEDGVWEKVKKNINNHIAAFNQM